jgi:hypothetical protein
MQPTQTIFLRRPPKPEIGARQSHLGRCETLSWHTHQAKVPTDHCEPNHHCGGLGQFNRARRPAVQCSTEHWIHRSATPQGNDLARPNLPQGLQKGHHAFLSGKDTNTYSFWLPTHKADTTFEGNRIMVKKITGAPDPHPIMDQYIKSRDVLFPFHPQLWLKSNGSVPLCSWFIRRLHHYFSAHIAGQSLRAGGATAMAEAGAEPQLIKGAGQWSSTAFERYIRKNPVVLHALILSRSSHYDS